MRNFGNKGADQPLKKTQTYVGVFPDDMSKRKFRSEKGDDLSGHLIAPDGRKLAHSTQDQGSNSLLNSYKQEFFRKQYGGLYYQ
jgi:hypothetical protein